MHGSSFMARALAGAAVLVACAQEPPRKPVDRSTSEEATVQSRPGKAPVARGSTDTLPPAKHATATGTIVPEAPAAAARSARRTDTVAPQVERSARRVVVEGVDLTGVGYDRGSDSAPVVLVNFSDFGCPFCAGFARETEPAIDREFIRTGKVFFKYVPFVMGTFPNGQQAARAAECAADQGRFWAMHDQLYRRQREWKNTIDAASVFRRIEQELGLDVGKAAACYKANHLHPRSARATEAADRLGVRVTPSFVLNGKAIEGALPLPQFRELIEAAIRDAGR